MSEQLAPLAPSQRLLCGPGPTNVDPAALEAMRQPMLGHLDPELHEVLLDLVDLLRQGVPGRIRAGAAAAVHRDVRDGGRPREPGRARRDRDRRQQRVLRRADRRDRPALRMPASTRSPRSGANTSRTSCCSTPSTSTRTPRCSPSSTARRPPGAAPRRRARRGDARRRHAADGRLRDHARGRRARLRRLGDRLRVLVHPEVPGLAARHVPHRGLRSRPGAGAPAQHPGRRSRST